MKQGSMFWVSIAGGLFLAFAGGLAVSHFKLPPQPLLAKADATVRDMIKNRDEYYFGKPSGHLETLRFEETGMVVAGHPDAQPGVTLLIGLFGDTLGARLYDNDGALVHEWPVDFFKIAPGAMRYPFHALVHGASLFPNGDLLFNLDQRRLYRIDACGEVVWATDGGSHHSIDVDDDGFIWTPIKREWTASDDNRLAPVSVSVDRIGKFDPDTGELLLEIDLVEKLLEAELQGVAVSRDYHAADLVHLNDVEVLSSRDAAAFPEFDPGDLILSFRNTNQLWVLDGHSHAIKWWRTGPMHGQHDPDFHPDGSITVFDNRPSVEPTEANGFLGSMGGSRIIRLDPGSYEYDTVLESSDDLSFHSPYRGKHQVLENGNILVTETDAGRAFEVTADGKIVWSFVNGYDEDEVGWIMGAYRYPESFADFAGSECAGEN